MKLIILDHFRRWWWALVIALGVYFTFQAFVVRESPQSNDKTVAVIDSMIHTVHSVFIYQAVMWLGLILLWDFQRGFSRVLTSLPVTAKQIGRALWLAAVALPAIALAIAGLLAFLFFSGKVNETPRLEKILTESGFIALYLGAIFGALTFTRTTVRDTAIDRILTVASSLLLPLVMAGFIFSLMKILSLPKTVFVFIAYGALTVLGWLRAEQMVLRRAGGNHVGHCEGKKTTQHEILGSGGIGGLPYLVRKTFVQTMLFSLGIWGWMMLVPFIFNFSKNQNHAQTITSLTDGGLTPYYFVLILPIFNLVFQLRLLRTLPIAPSRLTTVIIFLPVISATFIGLIVTGIAGWFADTHTAQHVINSFLLVNAKVAVVTCVIVWRGLDAVTYLIGFLAMAGGNLMFLALSLIFHIHNNNLLEFPWWICLIIFLASVAVSFALTHRLLTKSSCVYRPQTMPATTWNMMRR